jgi:hypothetical protein
MQDNAPSQHCHSARRTAATQRNMTIKNKTMLSEDIHNGTADNLSWLPTALQCRAGSHQVAARPPVCCKSKRIFDEAPAVLPGNHMLNCTAFGKFKQV